MKKTPANKEKKIWLLNGAFAVTCLALLLFLLSAPEETTTRLPHDDTHAEFHLIKSKKEAGKLCTQCHSVEAVSPLPENHPPPYRCLFCHKRDN